MDDRSEIAAAARDVYLVRAGMTVGDREGAVCGTRPSLSR